MTDPTNTTVDVLKSMVDHPAGRAATNRHPARPTPDSPGRHRPAPGRTQVGHIDERRDDAPNPSIIDGVTLALLLVLGTLFGAGLIVSQLWHALGLFGAVLGFLIVANLVWIWKDLVHGREQ